MTVELTKRKCICRNVNSAYNEEYVEENETAYYKCMLKSSLQLWLVEIVFFYNQVVKVHFVHW